MPKINGKKLRPEYSGGLIKSGVKGKYASRFREGTNIVLVESDLHKLFQDSESFNRGLRRFAEDHHLL
jgi:hypothetical protein